MMSWPATATLPLDGLTMPQMTLIRVVLPAPFGPSNAKISPLRISRLMSLSAWKPEAYVLARFKTEMAEVMTAFGWRTRAVSHPRPRRLGLVFEALDLVALDHGQADVVETVEQTVLAVCVDLELHDAAVGSADFLLREIDRECGVGAALGIVEQLLQDLRRDLHRQNAVLETVVVKNIAERGRDHARDAEILERPGRVLARRAAAEIAASDQDLCLAISRLVEHKIGVLAAVVAVALFGEQSLAKPGALDGFQILLGDDHVGVDVDHLQRRRDALEHGEFFHMPPYQNGCVASVTLNGVAPDAGQPCPAAEADFAVSWALNFDSRSSVQT